MSQPAPSYRQDPNARAVRTDLSPFPAHIGTPNNRGHARFRRRNNNP